MNGDSRKREDELSYQVIGAAIEVHKELGPGLLESIYEECFVSELRNSGLSVERQKPISITYKGQPVSQSLRLDLLVDNAVIVEVKSVDALLPIHHAQVLTYLKLTSIRLGLLINFNEAVIKNGIQRIVNKL